MASNSYILPPQGATCSSSRLTVTTTRWKTLGLLLLRLQCMLHLCVKNHIQTCLAISWRKLPAQYFRKCEDSMTTVHVTSLWQ